MKRLTSIGLLLLLAVAWVAVSPAGASTFIKMTQKDLIRNSAAVVQGQVLKVHSFWDPTGRIVMSEASIRVEEKILGNAPTVVVVRTFGGTVGNFTVEAHGFPKFQANERVLLYLEPEKDGASRVAGYQQGQFHVVRDQTGVELAVPATQDDATVLNRDGSLAARAQAIRLDVLKASIRDEARRAGRPLEN
ncbi:MAG TPA: hypothetical protein VF173_36930 [Thermoanaerobaculia bacterium]|nr:hypothetical protein [Thermoanaerobaculia bacterium]